MASSKFYCRYITMIMVCILILSLCIFKKKESFISVLPTVIAQTSQVRLLITD